MNDTNNAVEEACGRRDKKSASKQKSVNRKAPELVFTVSHSQVVVSFSDRTLQIQQHKIVAKHVCPNVPTLAA